MPRNGSGTHSIPNSFSSGTTISSSAVNANFTDIATEITGSLPRDGQAAMTGQFQATAGSATSPGIAFSGDTNTGVFRKAADTLGFSAGGTEIASATSTAFTITGLTATSASLTTPTIAGATLSGTLAGTPTFSGAVTFGAAPTLSDGLTVSAGTVALPAGSIETADLADSAVSTIKIAAGAVTGPKLGSGCVVATSYTETASRLTSNANIPYDDTVPLVSEGTEALSLSHTALSASNTLKIEVAGMIANGAAGRVTTIAVFLGSTCVGVNSVVSPSTEKPQAIDLTVRVSAGSTSAQTISVRFGSESTDTVTINGISSGRAYGGACKFTLTVTEIAA